MLPLTKGIDVQSGDEQFASFWGRLYDDIFDQARFVYYRTLGRVAKLSFELKSKALERMMSDSPSYQVIQFWDSVDIPDDVRSFMDGWKASYPDRYVRFSGAEALAFIQANFSPDDAEAYQQCWHPAMKSDYFRLCYLLKNGGCYVDADEVQIAPLPLVEHRHESFLMARPLIRGWRNGAFTDIDVDHFVENYENYQDAEVYFNNAPIIVSAGNPVIALALERARSIILSDRKGTMSLHDITGPSNLSMSIVMNFLDAGLRGEAATNVIALDWLQYARTGTGEELAYKNDEGDWRKAATSPQTAP